MTGWWRESNSEIYVNAEETVALIMGAIGGCGHPEWFSPAALTVTVLQVQSRRPSSSCMAHQQSVIVNSNKGQIP